MLKKTVFISLAGFLFLNLAAAPLQTHPFSQLTPPDEDLDFGGKDAVGLSELETARILANTSDLKLQTSGAGNILVYDDSESEWEVQNTDFNLSHNDIRSPANIKDFFASACPSGEAVQVVNSDGSYSCVDVSSVTSSEDLNLTLTAGNEANQSIDMMANDLKNPGSITSYFSSACGTGEVVDGVNSDGSYSCVSVDGEGTTEGLPATLEANNTANQTIDLDQNDLSDVANIYQDDSSTNFFGGCSSGNYVESISSDGSVTCTSDSTGANTAEDLNKTLTAGNEANQSIDMMTNSILNPNQVDGVDLDDPGNALSLSGDQYVVSSDSIDTGELNSNAVTDTELDNSGSFTVGGLTSNAEVNLSNSALQFAGTGATNITSTGKIEAGGDLDLGSNQLSNVGSTDCSANEFIDGDGNCVADSTGSSTTNVETLNETLLAGNLANQTIKMDGNSIESIGNLGGSNIVNTANINSGAVTNTELASDSVTNDSIDNTETVMLDGATLTADLNMSSNSINNFFASACSGGKVIDKVNSDGTYSCVDPTEDTGTEGLPATLEANNTANQSIDMGQNAVNQIGTGETNITSTGKIEAGGDIDVGGNNLNSVSSIDNAGSSVTLDDDVDLNGNSVTTSTGEVCIGDQCS